VLHFPLIEMQNSPTEMQKVVNNLQAIEYTAWYNEVGYLNRHKPWVREICVYKLGRLFHILKKFYTYIGS
jgi:hypothetical protein